MQIFPVEKRIRHHHEKNKGCITRRTRLRNKNVLGMSPFVCSARWRGMTWMQLRSGTVRVAPLTVCSLDRIGRPRFGLRLLCYCVADNLGSDISLFRSEKMCGRQKRFPQLRAVRTTVPFVDRSCNEK